MVGNFADKEHEREISKDKAIEFMKHLVFVHYVETSAYTGQNINMLFETVTKHLYLLNEDKILN